MNKLTRYIASTVLVSVLAAILVVAGIFLIFNFVVEANNTGQGSYTIAQAMMYTLLSLPDSLYLILPMAGLLGTLVGLGILAGHSELIAMRAAGVSVKQIAKIVCYSATVLMLISLLIGTYIGPVVQHMADVRRAIERTDQAVLLAPTATWLKDDNDFIYIGQSLPNGELLNVARYEIVQHQLQTIISAKSAQFKDQHWVLHNVVITSFNDKQISEKHYSEQDLQRLVPPNLLKVIVTQPQYLTLGGLWSFIHYQRANGIDVSQNEQQFWSILLQPVAILILMLMAVPFVFGPLRSSSMGLRLIAGLILGFAFFIVSQFFGPFSLLYDVPPFLGALLPNLLFAFILWVLMKRMT